MLIKKGQSLAASAEKAEMTEKTARKYLKSGQLPDEIKKDHIWRTREDPFKEDEESLKDLLENNPLLEAKTVFGHLQENNPGKYHNGQLRTLQGRFKQWRDKWNGLRTYFEFPQEIRTIIYTNNAVEALHRQLRKVSKAKTQFPRTRPLQRCFTWPIRKFQKSGPCP